MLLTAAFILAYHPQSFLEIRNIDVGQGDCALITGRNLPVIMIDGGSSDIRQVAGYRIVPVLRSNGISCIDRCYLTHMDSDHVNGVIEILENDSLGIKIRSVVISTAAAGSIAKDVQKRENGNLERLKKTAKACGTDILVCGEGDISSFDGSGGMTLYLKCISPPADKTRIASKNTDENDSSLVLIMEYGTFVAAFTGDIGEEVEQGVLADIPDCTYLKVAHHGSRYSSSTEFLKKADPEVAVISAGVGNSYGHPHAETLERLKKSKSVIYCTKDWGEIITRYDKTNISCTRFMAD